MSDPLIRAPRPCRGERGVHLIELAIALPLFVGVLFVMFDLARITSGYSAVRSAVAIGARRGAALQRPEWVAVSSMFGGSGGEFVQQLPVGDVRNLPAPEFTDSDIGNDWYTCMMEAGNDDCDGAERDSLDYLYRVELRAIAYANEAMRRNVGSSVFPCDAEKGGSPGCFRCFTMRGDPDYKAFFSTGGVGENWMVKMLALECEYDVPITSTSIALGWFPRHLTVSSSIFLNIDFYDNFYFMPGAG